MRWLVVIAGLAVQLYVLVKKVPEAATVWRAGAQTEQCEKRQTSLIVISVVQKNMKYFNESVWFAKFLLILR